MAVVLYDMLVPRILDRLCKFRCKIDAIFLSISIAIKLALGYSRIKFIASPPTLTVASIIVNGSNFSRSKIADTYCI